MMTVRFDYGEFTARNTGFVTPERQARLRNARIFMCGVGGMGGAAFMARAGVGRFDIAGVDRFEVSNLDRQVFANAGAIGAPKAENAAQAARDINPTTEIDVHGAEWRDELLTIDKRAAMIAEVEHVMTHSSSHRYIDLEIAGEVAAGRRSRVPFAPMVITTGMLTAYDAIALGERTSTDCRGWFFNPHKPAVERPLPAIVAALKRPLVRRALAHMLAPK